MTTLMREVLSCHKETHRADCLRLTFVSISLLVEDVAKESFWRPSFSRRFKQHFPRALAFMDDSKFLAL